MINCLCLSNDCIFKKIKYLIVCCSVLRVMMKNGGNFYFFVAIFENFCAKWSNKYNFSQKFDDLVIISFLLYNRKKLKNEMKSKSIKKKIMVKKLSKIRHYFYLTNYKTFFHILAFLKINVKIWIKTFNLSKNNKIDILFWQFLKHFN